MYFIDNQAFKYLFVTIFSYLTTNLKHFIVKAIKEGLKLLINNF